jgi:hypothetical protein
MVPFNCTIRAWNLTTDAGTVIADAMSASNKGGGACRTTLGAADCGIGNR